MTSNPSPAYVAAVAAVFNDNGAGVRGDLAAVVRAILTHPEAGAVDDRRPASCPSRCCSSCRSCARSTRTVTDHPFMSDKAEEMGQKVFYPPSVFSYFSPGYRVRGTAAPSGAPLGGPEFQILTTVTALERANFVGALLGGYFGDDVAIDYTPFTSRAARCGGARGLLQPALHGRPDVGRGAQRDHHRGRQRSTPSSNATERARTALYLTLVAAQAQVDR